MTSQSTTRSKAPLKKSDSAWQPPLMPVGVTQKSKLPQPWQPHDYQKQAAQFMLERGAAALFLDPGLGKTSITAAVLKILKEAGQMRGCLVVAPLRVCKLVWPAEFKKWSDFQGLSVGVLHGDHKMRVLEAAHDVYVINHAGLPWLFERTKKKLDGTMGKTWNYRLTAAGKLLMKKVNILVLDELSKFKHTETQRFKALKPWLGKFDRRYGLTGSPASNGLVDLFGQCYVLDGGRSLGPFISHYKTQYFSTVGERQLVLKPGAEDLIYARVRPLALRMSAEDHLKLPRVRNYTIKLELPEATRRHYDNVEEEFLTVINKEVFTAPNAAASMNMCRQICSGAIYNRDIDPITGIKKQEGRKWTHLHDVKLDALEDLVDELQGQQLLIAYDYQHDLERILTRWPKLPHFGKSEREDARLEREWNAGSLPVVAGHPGSIGHGLNLQDSNAHNVLWFTLTWDYELYDQFIRRLLRQGNKSEHVNVYMFIMKDTVEEYVASVLRRKKRTQDDLNEALKKRTPMDD